MRSGLHSSQAFLFVCGRPPIPRPLRDTSCDLRLGSHPFLWSGGTRHSVLHTAAARSVPRSLLHRLTLQPNLRRRSGTPGRGTHSSHLRHRVPAQPLLRLDDLEPLRLLTLPVLRPGLRSL
ncbi:hypothetical protein NDU88_001606 [Pleurodeles waltl]|uniref:Uncharacterized protein n=1 Tax=Pleurodeles waltl TaxID=8319 RepID=A0AAV7T010_PLEWA|nr:hypothetical protein NDU88_001606 [Pleurodeles waltl]